MIHTLSSDCYLHKVQRNRLEMLTAMERRKAFLYCVGIAVCVTTSVLIWIVFR